MTRALPSNPPHRAGRARAVCLGSLAVACALLTAGPSGAQQIALGRTQFADRDGDKIFDTLGARLQRAQLNTAFDVVVTFCLPLEQVNVPLVQAQVGAFGATRPLRLARAVATRLTRRQINALARAGIVEQIEPDEEMVAFRAAAMHWFGVTGARADFGLTGDGDGSPDSFTKADNTIAIIDTGIDAGHVELDGGKVIGWVDLVNSRPTPYDDEGHGTHVASIAAGKQVGDGGGVAPGAALVGVKVLDSRGSATNSRVAQGIDWCVQNRDTYGIRVINLSLGGSSPSAGTDVVSRTVDAAVAAGITVVCAAGNDGPRTTTVGSPAAARGAIAVGAVADPDVGGVYLASWSSRGSTADGRVKPDVVAPGVAISAAKANSTNGYVTYSGTSMASPFVAGVVAVLLQASPGLSPAEVYEDLTQSARDAGLPGPDNEYGYGLLDAYAALRPSAGMGSNAPPSPEAIGSGAITAETRSATHTFEVAGTQYPIAVTVVITNWARSNTDLDAELYDPAGNRVAVSNGSTRQETLSWKPRQAGTYTLRVYGYRNADRAAYFFDVSADLAPPADQGGAPPPDGEAPPP